MNIHRPLENPAVYQLSQLILAPGAETAMRRLSRALLARLPANAAVLDVGCGPSSRLRDSGHRVIGIDVSLPYIRAGTAAGQSGAVATATSLPFVDSAFDSVWNIGLLHHLDDADAGKAVAEFLRVCTPGGMVVVLDAVMPRQPLLSPLPYLLRRLDRGRHVRTEEQMHGLLAPYADWRYARRIYTATGLALLECVAEAG